MGLIDLYIGQLSEDYKSLKDFYNNFKDIRDVIIGYVDCYDKIGRDFENRHKDGSDLTGKKGVTFVTQLIAGSMRSCADLITVALKKIWEKGWDIVFNTAKVFFDIGETSGEADPIILAISVLASLWKNPHVLNEWVSGLVAATARVSGDQSLITLTVNPLADVDWTKVITDMDCSYLGQGLQVDALQFADVTGDGKAEAFVAVSCKPINDSWPDYFEVFDGASESGPSPAYGNTFGLP